MDLVDNCDGDPSHRRSKNFTNKEVDLLLNLIAQNIDVIECKKTDKVTLSGKESTWKFIEKEFNKASTDIYRDIKTLKGKYDNLKKQSKKKWADNKDALTTGGVPSTSANDTLNETDYRIKEMLGGVLINGTKSTYDCDFITSMRTAKTTHLGLSLSDQSSQSQSSSSVEAKSKVVGDLLLNEDSETISVLTPNVSSPLTREKLRRISDKFSIYKRRTKPPVSLILNTKSTNTFSTRQKILNSKHELLGLQKQVLYEQIQFQREDHKLKTSLTQKEHDERMRLLKLRIRNEELILQTRLVEIQHITRRQPLFRDEFE